MSNSVYVPRPLPTEWQADTSYKTIEDFEKAWPEAVFIAEASYCGYEDAEAWRFYRIGDVILVLWAGSGIEFSSNDYELSESSEEEMAQIIQKCEQDND